MIKCVQHNLQAKVPYYSNYLFSLTLTTLNRRYEKISRWFDFYIGNSYALIYTINECFVWHAWVHTYVSIYDDILFLICMRMSTWRQIMCTSKIRLSFFIISTRIIVIDKKNILRKDRVSSLLSKGVHVLFVHAFHQITLKYKRVKYIFSSYKYYNNAKLSSPLYDKSNGI